MKWIQRENRSEFQIPGIRVLLDGISNSNPDFHAAVGTLRNSLHEAVPFYSLGSRTNAPGGKPRNRRASQPCHSLDISATVLALLRLLFTNTLNTRNTPNPFVRFP